MTRYRYTDDDLRRLVAESFSVTEVMRKLGMRLAGGSHYHISGRIRRLGLDTSHFLGHGSNKGRAFPAKRRKAEDVFKIWPADSPRPKGYILRRLLQEAGIEYECSKCGIVEWQNEPLTLDVDHVNGDWLDNRKENLRFLCPNCHSQTPNFGSKNKAL